MRTEISTLFELPTPPRRSAAAPSHHAATPSSTLAALAAPTLSTPSVAIAPGPGRPKRVFQNITEVGESSLFDAPAPPRDEPPRYEPPRSEPRTAEPPQDAPNPQPAASESDSLRARLRQKLKDERDEDEATNPLSPQFFEASIPNLADDLAAALAEDGSAEPKPEPKTSSEPAPALQAKTDSEPKSESESAPESESESESEPESESESEPEARLIFEPLDHQGPWELRVDAMRYDPVDQDGLALLLKTGIWADAVELLTESGHWIPLSRHPIYPQVRQLLMRQTQKIVAQVTTGDWERKTAEAPAPPNAPLSPQRKAPAENAALDGGEALAPTQALEGPRTPDESSMPSAVAWVIALLTGILCGMVALLIFEPNTLRAPMGSNTATPASTAPEERPTLIIPPRSEGDDMSAVIAFSRARAEVSRAHGVIRFSQGLIAHGRPKLARQRLLDAMMADGMRPDLKDAFNRAIAADPLLHAAPVTLGVDEPISGIAPLGGGRSISFRITRADGTLASFKPAQDEWGQGWRGELSGYLFCEIVPCHFKSPKNQAARLSRPHFEAYYASKQNDWRASYATRFDAIHWTREPGPDGVVRDYMYGTYEEWIPHFVKWPIEYTQVYEDLLDIRFHPDDLNMPYAELLAPLKTLGDGRFYKRLLADQGDASSRDIARQISSLLVFDHLTQNWDRFSSTEKYYGVNNQFADGIFISIDNGAAFTDEDVNTTVTPRFELTSRFSRSMVTAVRALDPAVVNEVFFPNPNLNARRRLSLFWRQRKQMLARVDALVEKYGPDRVYEFE